MADGQPDQRKIACEIAKAQPDLMLVVGDIVYPSGTISEYLHHFWNEIQQHRERRPRPRRAGHGVGAVVCGARQSRRMVAQPELPTGRPGRVLFLPRARQRSEETFALPLAISLARILDVRAGLDQYHHGFSPGHRSAGAGRGVQARRGRHLSRPLFLLVRERPRAVPLSRRQQLHQPHRPAAARVDSPAPHTDQGPVEIRFLPSSRLSLERDALRGSANAAAGAGV